MANERLYASQCDEMFTEYPFFRDGMTLEEFQKEQKAYFDYLISGGNPFLYEVQH
jgi:hypothetical protein